MGIQWEMVTPIPSQLSRHWLEGGNGRCRFVSVVTSIPSIRMDLDLL